MEQVAEELKRTLRSCGYRDGRLLCEQLDRVVVPRASSRARKLLAATLREIDARFLHACPQLRNFEARRHRSRMIGRVMAPEHLDRLVMAFNAVPPVNE